MNRRQLSVSTRNVRNVVCLAGVLVFAAVVVLATTALGLLDDLLAVAPLIVVAGAVAGTVPAIRNPLRRLFGLDPI